MTEAATAAELRALWSERDNRYSMSRWTLDLSPELVEGIKVWRHAETEQVPADDRAGLWYEVEHWQMPGRPR